MKNQCVRHFFGVALAKVITTPGHTAGCMSFIFPVQDNGEKHTACIFGGATPPWGDEAGKEIQKRSVIKFMKAVKDDHRDVALVNHTAFQVHSISQLTSFSL